MNYLAHFHLAWPEAELLAGALEGDFHKGPLGGGLPRGIEQGVKLHRAIDAFTDRHPEMARLRRAFPADLRRYSGILVDISFDHFLSRYWSRFSDASPREFNRAVYACLAAHLEHLSPGARNMYRRMVEHDLLGVYASWDSVPASALRVGERFRRGNPFRDAARRLAPHRELLERTFLAFYPEAVEFALTRREELN